MEECLSYVVKILYCKGLGGETATFHPTEAERTESSLETEEGVHEQA